MYVGLFNDDSGMSATFYVGDLQDRTARFSFSVGSVETTGAEFAGKETPNDQYEAVDVGVKADEKVPEIKIVTPKSELIEAVLTDDEKAALSFNALIIECCFLFYFFISLPVLSLFKQC